MFAPSDKMADGLHRPILVKRPSDKQLSRLRNGHKVRLAKPIEGEGMNLLVDPSKFNSITRCFDKGKGVMVQLSPEEISSNMSIGGEGIFGRKFDRFLKKVGIKKAVYKVADVAKPVVKEAIKEGLKVAPIPEKYKPMVEAGADMLTKYIDDPEKYQSKEGVGRLLAVGAETAAKGYVKQGVKGLKASPAPAPAGKGLGKVGKRIRKMQRASLSAPAGDGLGMGCGGAGLYTARGSGVMGRGALMSSVGNSGLPPALQSQNASANFHFSTQLPPSLARIHLSGAGLYM